MKVHYPDRKIRHQSWSVELSETGSVSQADAQLIVLMDIRDELQRLNRVVGCPNFLKIPTTLKAIQRKLPAKRKRRV